MFIVMDSNEITSVAVTYPNRATTSFTSVGNEADLVMAADVHPSNMATTPFTLVGNSADSPAPPLRPSPATGHAAEILDV
jgi:hypothetical protein